MDKTHETNNTELTISTINVNGLNENHKRAKIFNWFKTKKIDITLLQETHSTTTTAAEWKKEWDKISVWNSGPFHLSAGVAILLNQNLIHKIQNINSDNQSRRISIDIK